MVADDLAFLFTGTFKPVNKWKITKNNTAWAAKKFFLEMSVFWRDL